MKPFPTLFYLVLLAFFTACNSGPSPADPPPPGPEIDLVALEKQMEGTLDSLQGVQLRMDSFHVRLKTLVEQDVIRYQQYYDQHQAVWEKHLAILEDHAQALEKARLLMERQDGENNPLEEELISLNDEYLRILEKQGEQYGQHTEIRQAVEQ